MSRAGYCALKEWEGRMGKGFLAMLALAAAMAVSAPAVALPDWNGIWLRQGSINFDPNVPGEQVDTGAPLTPEYAARYQQKLAARAAGKPTGDPTAACLPGGMPRVMNMVYPMELFINPGQVTIIAEWDNQVRRIFTDGRGHPADPDPTFQGHSIGHWEGNELVVDTVAIRSDTVLTQAGMEHSDVTRVAERFRMRGDTLEDELTLIDPKMLTKPWTVIKRFKRAPKGFDMMEYVCEDNNRNPIDANGVTGVVLTTPPKP
jgi:hypothetical protein